MLAGRGQTVVDGRGDQHFDDRFFRPAESLRVAPGLVHVIERRSENDAALMMFRHRRAGQAGEIWQLRQGNVHAERA